MKNALVVGASRGLGKALALTLVRGGWQVDCLGREIIHDTPTLGNYIALDVRGNEEKVAHMGAGKDLVVWCAGVAHKPKKVQELSKEEIMDCLQTNYLSPFLFTQHLLKSFWGTLVYVASYCGVRGVPLLGAYCPSKAALRNLAMVVGKENPNLRVYCLSPGGMNTRMREEVFGDAERQQDPMEVVRGLLWVLKLGPKQGEIIVRDGKVYFRGWDYYECPGEGEIPIG